MSTQTDTMNLTINRNGQCFGPYTLPQVNTYLASGQLVPTDLARRDETADWAPLSEVQGAHAESIPESHTPSRRSVGVVALVGTLWTLGFWFAGGFCVGFVMGILHPGDAMAARHAARALGQAMSLPLLGISLYLTFALMAAGKLPGARR